MNSNGMVFATQWMKLEQIKVSQNMQMLFLTLLKLFEFEEVSTLSALFISNEMLSPQTFIIP